MKNMVADLQKIIPVPDSPIDIDKSMLAKNAKQLNVEFPSDFLEFVSIYGSGSIEAEDFYRWEIISPARNTYCDFTDFFYKRNIDFRESGDNYDLPFELYAKEGGLLPFGGIDDLYFTWKIEGKADNWKVIVFWLYEPDGYQIFNLNFSEFLWDFLTRKIEVEGFVDQWNYKTDLIFESEVYGC